MSVNFASVVASKLKGQFVEIYLGDPGEVHKFSEFERTEKNVIRGVLEDIVAECLIVKYTSNFNKTGHPATNHNTIYINSWQVKTILTPQNGLGTAEAFSDEGLKVSK